MNGLSVPKLLFFTACLILGGVGMLYPQIRQMQIEGIVTDEYEVAIPEALVTLESQNTGRQVETTTDKNGTFRIQLDASATGMYLLRVSARGYWPLVRHEPIEITSHGTIISVKLIEERVTTTNIDVNSNIYSERHLDIQQIEMSQPVSGELIDKIPATGAHKQLENTIAAMPGVVRDVLGRLHLRGSPSDQINWKFNELFDIASPISGQLDAYIGPQTAELYLLSSRYGVEYGPGSGGVIAVNTKNGEFRPRVLKSGKKIRFRENISNFLPGIQFVKGFTFDSWVPRLEISGPLIQDRLSIYSGFNADYRMSIFPELPKGEDRSHSWNASSIFKLQAKLTPLNTLTTGFLLNYTDRPHANLTPLDPLETTVNKRAERTFFYIRDQIIRPSNSILELGYGMYRSRSHDTPQGQDVYRFSPNGRGGDFSYDALLYGDRDEWLATYLAPRGGKIINHELKFGMNASALRYEQDIKRSGIDYFRLDGTKVSSIRYAGPSAFKKSYWETSGFAQDRWQPRFPWLLHIFPQFLVETGVRWDRNSFLEKSVVTPRFAIAAMPAIFRERTKVSAGISLVPEKGNENLFTRGFDQRTVNTRYDKDGLTPTAGWATAFVVPEGSLNIPTIINVSAGIEQELPGAVYLQLNYLHKHESRGYAYFPSTVGSMASHADVLLPPDIPVFSFTLTNAKRESYNSVELGITKNFKPKFTTNTYECFASIEISDSLSNAAASADVDEPIAYENRVGRMPWDTPHRLLSWGIFPLDEKKRNEIRYLLEWRDGFPFSAYDGEFLQVGGLNTWRLPRYFTLNIQYGKRISRFGREWELRFGVENITNNDNAVMAIQNTASPWFGTFVGIQPRRFVFGIRVIGNGK